jgi:hypothetical protein
LEVSQDAVWRTWQAFSLQPHRQEKFKLSADPQFVEKVYDICGLYLNPPERAVVLCIDLGDLAVDLLQESSSAGSPN